MLTRKERVQGVKRIMKMVLTKSRTKDDGVMSTWQRPDTCVTLWMMKMASIKSRRKVKASNLTGG